MTIKQFIEKAIEGGWQFKVGTSVATSVEAMESDMGLGTRILAHWADGYARNVYIQEILLDPLAWQAVGKVEGWEGKCSDCYRGEPHKWCLSGSHLDMHGKYFRNKPWVDAMHRMIDALADGKTITEFLDTL